MKELKKQLRKQIAQEKRRHGITELITKSAALLEKLEQQSQVCIGPYRFALLFIG